MKVPSQKVKLPTSTKDLSYEEMEQLKPLYAIAAQMRLQNQIEAFKAGLIDRDEVEVSLLKVDEPEQRSSGSLDIKPDVVLVPHGAVRAPKEDESELMYT